MIKDVNSDKILWALQSIDVTLKSIYSELKDLKKLKQNDS